MTEQVQARSATLTWRGPHELEIRFTSGILLDGAGIAEVIRTRKHMCAGKPVGLLLIVPSDTELDVGIINTDHLKVNQATDNVLGFAVVAGNEIAETLLRLYKAYYPTIFEAEVFTDEAAARTWLAGKVAQALEPSKG
jgi:hypothetical protein